MHAMDIRTHCHARDGYQDTHIAMHATDITELATKCMFGIV
jgi:hypothetical protein